MLLEDGIVEIPFCHSYQFNLSDETLQCDDMLRPLENDGTIETKELNQNSNNINSQKDGDILIKDNSYIPNFIYRKLTS